MPVGVYGQGTVADSYSWTIGDVQPGLPADRWVGIEAAMWCESVENSDDLFFQLLPRLAGVADKAWTGDRSWDDYRPRLAAQGERWSRWGLSWFRSSTVW